MELAGIKGRKRERERERKRDKHIEKKEIGFLVVCFQKTVYSLNEIQSITNRLALVITWCVCSAADVVEDYCVASNDQLYNNTKKIRVLTQKTANR